MNEYKNSKITVRWDSKKCSHSAVCIRSLPEVFDLNQRPWVNIDGAASDKIRETIDNCPSGALTYELPSASNVNSETLHEIKLLKNGPIVIKGSFKVIDSGGTEFVKEGSFSLCRCGASENKPFCDGTHKKTSFVAD